MNSRCCEILCYEQNRIVIQWIRSTEASLIVHLIQTHRDIQGTHKDSSSLHDQNQTFFISLQQWCGYVLWRPLPPRNWSTARQHLWLWKLSSLEEITRCRLRIFYTGWPRLTLDIVIEQFYNTNWGQTGLVTHWPLFFQKLYLHNASKREELF